MADYPDMTFETLPYRDALLAASALITTEDINAPYELGFAVAVTSEYWMNKVWDAGGSAWVSWESAYAPDLTGRYFPDPHGSGWAAVSGTYRTWRFVP